MLVVGGEVRNARGAHNIGTEAAEFGFREGAVEGDEAGHGGGCLEGEYSDGHGEVVVVMTVAEP